MSARPFSVGFCLKALDQVIPRTVGSTFTALPNHPPPVPVRGVAPTARVEGEGNSRQIYSVGGCRNTAKESKSESGYCAKTWAGG